MFLITSSRLSAQQFRYLRQQIALTGLSSPTFTSALYAAGEVYGYFDCQFSEGMLESWTASQELHDTPCFDLSNRYLTPAKETNDPDVPFQKGVDPRGILCRMATSDGTCSYVHMEDNEVQYFTACREGNGNRK